MKIKSETMKVRNENKVRSYENKVRNCTWVIKVKLKLNLIGKDDFSVFSYTLNIIIFIIRENFLC